MRRRPAIPLKDKISAAIAQAANGHIFCPLCRRALEPFEPRILEHLVARAFTGSDELKFLAWVHKACADLKTYGNKATVADGDIHKIAKAKRLAAANQVHRAVTERVMKREPSRLKGRGFDKTKTRKINGETVERRKRNDHNHAG